MKYNIVKSERSPSNFGKVSHYKRYLTYNADDIVSENKNLPLENESGDTVIPIEDGTCNFIEIIVVAHVYSEAGAPENTNSFIGYSHKFEFQINRDASGNSPTIVEIPWTFEEGNVSGQISIGPDNQNTSDGFEILIADTAVSEAPPVIIRTIRVSAYINVYNVFGPGDFAPVV